MKYLIFILLIYFPAQLFQQDSKKYSLTVKKKEKVPFQSNDSLIDTSRFRIVVATENNKPYLINFSPRGIGLLTKGGESTGAIIISYKYKAINDKQTKLIFTKNGNYPKRLITDLNKAAAGTRFYVYEIRADIGENENMLIDDLTEKLIIEKK